MCFLLCVGSKNLIKSPVAGSVKKSMKLLLRRQHAFYVCAVLFFIVRPSLIFSSSSQQRWWRARPRETERNEKYEVGRVGSLSLPLSYCCIVSACSLSLIDFSSIDLCVSPTSPNIHHPPRPPAAPISLSGQKQTLQNSVQNACVAHFFLLSIRFFTRGC